MMEGSGTLENQLEATKVCSENWQIVYLPLSGLQLCSLLLLVIVLFVVLIGAFRSGTDLVACYSSCSSWGNFFQKYPRLCHFKTDWIKIWQECSSSKYASKSKLDFRFDHSCKMVAMTSFYATKCCHLMCEHEASAVACAAAFVSFCHIRTCLFYRESLVKFVLSAANSSRQKI